MQNIAKPNNNDLIVFIMFFVNQMKVKTISRELKEKVEIFP